MKRLIVFLIALLASASLSAQVVDRDILLTGDGKLFTIQTFLGSKFPELENSSSSVIRLTIQKDEKIENVFVPASLTGGINSDPSLAYDSASDTIFAFWQHMPNPMSSELLFCSYHDGQWSEPTSIDAAAFHIRFHLRIGVTKVESAFDDAGEPIMQPQLIIHAIWWDQTGIGTGESGRYAMLVMNQQKNQQKVEGKVVVHDLLEFADGAQSTIASVDPNFDRDFFRHPAIFESPNHQSVEVIFANWQTNRFERVQIKPRRDLQPNGVLHVPVGVHRGEFDGPPQFNRSESSKISVVSSPGSANYGFYFTQSGRLMYLSYMNGRWSAQKSVALSENLSMETAVEALRKLVSSE
ncbi:MAG TPA: hypothetical protein VHL58_00315 [Thermoanaerobaculia bacterium]|nr:hypothetical protein [Thermoanaerobaculia bacterium]